MELAEGLNILQERQVQFQNDFERCEDFIQQKEVEWLQKQCETGGDFVDKNRCNLYANKSPIVPSSMSINNLIVQPPATSAPLSQRLLSGPTLQRSVGFTASSSTLLIIENQHDLWNGTLLKGDAAYVPTQPLNKGVFQ